MGALKWCAPVFLFLAFARPSAAQAASMYMSPSSGTYSVGQTISVSVYVSSNDQAMNAASGLVTYPSSLMSASSASTAGTVISLWSTQPTYSNDTSSATFEGVVLNPGYKGQGGKIATYSFTANYPGTATIAFARGRVLANDGLGTDITNGLSGASFTIVQGSGTTPATPNTPTAPSGGSSSSSGGRISVPVAPTIMSSTHPDSTKWYTASDASVSWELPGDALNTSFLLDHDPASDAGTEARGLKSAFEYPGLEEGEWYFHLKVKNAAGWSDTAHYRIGIDKSAPELFSMRTETEDNEMYLVLEARDSGSGIRHYALTFDDSPEVIWKDDGSHRLPLSPLAPGAHPIKASAVDKAGNSTPASLTVVIPEKSAEAVAPWQNPWWKEILSTIASFVAARPLEVAIIAGLSLALLVLALVLKRMMRRYRLAIAARDGVAAASFPQSSKLFAKAFKTMEKEAKKIPMVDAPARARANAHIKQMTLSTKSELDDIAKDLGNCG